MKNMIFIILTIGTFASSAFASELECRLLDINDSPSDVKPVRVSTTAAEQVIGNLRGEQISIYEFNGFIHIRARGDVEVAAGSKSGNQYLEIEGASVECSSLK